MSLVGHCPDPRHLSSIHQLRSKVSQEHEVLKKKELDTGPKASYGYGGKFGTERDRMDKVRAAGGSLHHFLAPSACLCLSGGSRKPES